MNGTDDLFLGFAVTQQGISHREKEKICQDASGYAICPQYAIAVVSDGHGGEKYIRSAAGSRIAVEVTLSCLHEFLSDYQKELNRSVDEREKCLQHIERRIVAQWREKIQEDFEKNPLTADETELCKQLGIASNFQVYFYGATLLYACMTREYSFAAQIGDGQCISLYADGSGEFPIEDDDRLGFGMTTSLCDSDAINSFRHWFNASYLLNAIFIVTDGVADSYPLIYLQQFSRKIFDNVLKNEQFAIKQLKDWLPILSERGSRDDMSIAGIFRKGISYE